MSLGADDNTSDCVLCGKCLEVCPLLAATGREELSPRAKAHLVTLLESDPDLLREQDVAALAGLCLGCGRCKEVCSQGVNIPEAISRLREKHPGWKSWLWKQWMKHADTLWPAAGKIASKLPAGLGPERLTGLLKMARSLDRKPIASFVHINSFPDQFQHTEALLFPGCAAGGAQGNTNEGTASYWTTSAQTLCRGLGISLIEAPFSCCGSSLQGAGLRHERLHAAIRNVDIWRASGKVKLITFCASCLTGLASYAQDRNIFPDQEEAQAWKLALTPLSDLLNSARFVVSPNALADAPQAIAYHRPCHTVGKDADEALLRAMLPESELTISQCCCGFGGVMQLGAPGLTQKVSDRSWAKMNPTPGTTLFTGCTACVFQLAATAPDTVQVAHWLECLKMTAS